MKKVAFAEINASNGFYVLLLLLGSVVAVGLGAAYFMEHNGHEVTGMNNQIVWGMPHVFAVFLIVAASGALNVASIASVFGKSVYKPLAPLSGLLAITLLAGGLAVLVLDLGRPDRLIVAMTNYNFKSIFAWNIFLYTGFFAIVAVYLWMMMERRFNKYSHNVGLVAFVWRLLLTTGTGSIFGFLVARQAYDAAIMAPLFIVSSFAFGLAMYILVLVSAFQMTDREFGQGIAQRLRSLLGVFIGSVLLLTLIYHITNLYATEHHGIEAFILRDGGIYTHLFWFGQILLGSILPLIILFNKSLQKSVGSLVFSAALVVIGGFIQLYVIIIGGQAFPIDLFPGYEVTSSFYDGVVASYTPSLPEILLGFGGVALALTLTTVGVKVLRFLPVSLADKDVDPHHKA
ncbi:MAG: polysulfide reductase NrfD [Gammaproteobacteria bacterium]|nr:polysulfide reductase NrfD [Gammaproteobacteria bacterium]MDH5731250.1 polysulfide reductase NrfD [Gammaproteobacteria bacterium]